MTELLAPAGDLLCAKTALYNGADAIYCACEHFGARAYAKNLTMDELKTLLILAHSLNKKVYVTVNTIIKDTELDEPITFNIKEVPHPRWDTLHLYDVIFRGHGKQLEQIDEYDVCTQVAKIICDLLDD